MAGATLLAASTSNEETLTVPLSGQAELNFAHPFGSTGDLDGSGLVKLAIAPAQRKVCYDFSLSDVGTPMMVHIRQAKALQNGPPIVSLFTGPGGELDGCAPANTRQLEDMIAHPDDYYVSIATTEYPDGALRGQLAS
nr:CHRD domain-containing protein [Sphingomonas telluris]